MSDNNNQWRVELLTSAHQAHCLASCLHDAPDDQASRMELDSIAQAIRVEAHKRVLPEIEYLACVVAGIVQGGSISLNLSMELEAAIDRLRVLAESIAENVMARRG